MKLSRTLEDFGQTLALAALVSCAGPKSIPAPPSVAQDLLRSLEAGRISLKSVKAEARAEVSAPSHRARFHASILASRPDRMYVEASGFGFPAAMASVHGGRALLYFPNREEAYAGDTEGLSVMLGVGLSAEEWVTLLLGGIPAYPVRVVEAIQRGGEWRITTEKEGRRVELTLNAKSGWLEEYEEISPRRQTFKFGDPMETSSGTYPSSIEVVAPKGRLRLTFRSVKPNPEPPEEHFQIHLPERIVPRPLRDSGPLHSDPH